MVAPILISSHLTVSILLCWGTYPIVFSFDKFIVQEFVDGVEYNVDILYGRSSRVLSSCVKEKLFMRAGETDKARLCDQ